MSEDDRENQGPTLTASDILPHLAGKALLGELHGRVGREFAPDESQAAQVRVESLLVGAAKALRAQPRKPADPPTPESLAYGALAAAVFVVQSVQGGGSSLRATPGCEQAKLCRQARHRFLVLEGFAAAEGWSMGGLVGSPRDFSRMARLTDEFEEAVSPRPLSSLLKDMAKLDERQQVFLAKRPRPETEIVAEARAKLAAVSGLTGAAMARLVACLGVAKLRTYTDAQLLRAGGNFAKWEAIIAYLGRGADVPRSPLHEQQVEELREKLAHRVAMKWKSRLPDYDTEDAAQDAMKVAMELASDPRKGFSYECDIITWLVPVAVNCMRRKFRKRRWDEIRGIDVDLLPDPRPAESSPRDQERADQKEKEFFSLVLVHFLPESWRRVKEIYGNLFRKGGPDEIADNELADLIGKATGERPSRGGIATARRRIRQRFLVLDYLIEKVSAKEEADWGDAAVLAVVENDPGLAEGDMPTLRGLAALARASRHDETLLWAIVAKLLVGDVASRDAVRSVALSIVRDRAHLGLGDASAMEKQLDAACDWVEQPDNARLLSRLRGWAKLRHVLFFIAPCWYLAVLRGRSVAEIAEVLRPARAERPLVVEIAGRLQPRQPE